MLESTPDPVPDLADAVDFEALPVAGLLWIVDLDVLRDGAFASSRPPVQQS